MKNMFLILIFTLIISMGITVFNTSAQVSANDDGDVYLSLEGEEKATKGKEATINLKLNSTTETITTISGKIVTDNNISEIKLVSLNGWTIVHEKTRNTFIATKEEGAKTEEVFKITYKVAETAGESTDIAITDIKVTNIDTEEKPATDKSKTITIINGAETKVLTGIEVVDQPTKTAYKVGEKFDKTGMKVVATYSDGTTQTISNYSFTIAALTLNDKTVKIRYTEGGITKEDEVKISVTENGEPGKDDKETEESKTEKDNTITKNEIANTGLENNVTYAIMGVVTISGISYVAYKKYSIV